MSVEALSMVLKRSKAKNAPLLVMIAIADFYNDDEGCAWPGMERLAQVARCSVRSAQAAVRQLEELGELTVDYGTGPYGTNRYRINFKKMGEEVMPSLKGRPLKMQPPPPPAESAPPQNAVQNLQGGGAESVPDSAPKLLGTLSKRLEREERDEPAPPPPALDGDPDGEETPAKTPQDDLSRVRARLLEVWPNSPVGMTYAQEQGLKQLLPILQELGANDWEALRVYVNEADDRARALERGKNAAPVKLWPKTRAKFLGTEGEAEEMIEKVRTWWKARGKGWWEWKMVQAAKTVAKSSPPPAAEQEPGEAGEKVSVEEGRKALRMLRPGAPEEQENTKQRKAV